MASHPHGDPLAAANSDDQAAPAGVPANIDAGDRDDILAALDTAEVKKVRERVGFTTSNRASRARVLERPGPSGLRARASNGPPLCRAARARSLLTRMIEDRFVRI